MCSRSMTRAGLALVAVLSGCTSARADPLDPGPLYAGSDIPAQAIAQDPVGELTLRQAVASALVGNPELAVFSGEVRAREAAIVQARLLPNPELDVTATNLGNDVLRDFDGPQATVSLSQIILMGGKRAAGVRVAGLDRDLAAWDYEVKRLDVLTRVAQAFVAVLQAQQGLVLANDLVALAERVVAAVAARVQAGKSSPVEESRARVALASIRIERERATRELEAARTGLAATWGSTAPRFTKALGRLEDIHPVPAVEDLARRLRQNPDLARWASELAGREASLDLERRRAVPDLTATLGITHFTDTDDSALIAGISIPLPILNRNQGNIRGGPRTPRQGHGGTPRRRGIHYHGLARRLSATRRRPCRDRGLEGSGPARRPERLRGRKLKVTDWASSVCSMSWTRSAPCSGPRRNTCAR